MAKTRTREQLNSTIEKAEKDHRQTFKFAQPTEMRFNEMLEGVRADIDIEVDEDDYGTFETSARGEDDPRSPAWHR